MRYVACQASLILVPVIVACGLAACAREPMNNDSRFDKPEVAPLAAAVASGDAAEIRRQLATTHPDTPGADGATLLVEAIGRQKLESVEALLEGGADPNRPGGGGQTPVQAAAFVADPAFLRTVLAHGGDPNARNPITGATPLTDAILGQHQEQLTMLLAAGAAPGAADRNGDTPLHTAARTNAGAAILQLLQAGASPLAKNSGGATFQSYYFSMPRNVLNERARRERGEVVAWLKAHGVPLEAGVEADD